MIELTQSFTFEAAHFLPSAPDGNENRRIHGHSFKVEITVTGDPDTQTGLLIHFDAFKEICNRLVRDKIDHQLLNDIKGFENPTLENMCQKMWQMLIPELPSITSVTIIRESCGQKCVYRQ
ncbi:MAG: 6-pyruvoyltetrahydropterin/6-carboxytetrahydropterin synthase [Alphaproteobacteria bacterium]|jgi:6-pyruvoyltetrahydropterin/6-carboxytetrahydropterin synthase